MKVIIVDPGEMPKIVDIEKSDEFKFDTLEQDDIAECGYSKDSMDSHAIALKLLKEFNGAEDDNTFVERFKCNSMSSFGFYVDESGRIKHLKANRKIILPDRNGLNFQIIAGRLIVIPEMVVLGNTVVDEDFDSKRVQSSLDLFMHYNNNTGTNSLQLITQIECDL